MTAPGPSRARCLLDLVDAAGTRGVTAEEAAAALGIDRGELADLVRRMLAAGRGWLDRDTRRIYSTAPF